MGDTTKEKKKKKPPFFGNNFFKAFCGAIGYTIGGKV